jgi:hypothetical protein
MTKLPVAMVEAEALAFARGYIAQLAGPGPWGNSSPFGAEESRAMTRHLMRVWCDCSANSRRQLIAIALAGEEDARAVLHTLMIEMKSQHKDLPIELENYNMEVLADGLRPPPRGPKRKDRFTRNLCIAMTVAAVVDKFGLHPTRNPASRGRPAARRSACSIVAEALEVVHMRLGERAVETVWARLANAMPTVPGWAASLS